MSDPVADMLTRLRNANLALLPDVEVSHSKMKESIAHILKRGGYLAVVSVEGPAAFIAEVDARLDNPADREVLMRWLRLLETDTSLLGASGHLLGLARRP